MENSSQLPDGTCVGAVVFRTADLASLVEFYSNVLGMKLLDSTESQAVFGVINDSKPIKLLTLIEDKSAIKAGQKSRSLFHAAFVVPSRALLGQFFNHLTTSGGKLDGASDHLVTEALYLSDPDGNGLEVYWDRPKSAWSYTPDGKVVMALDPVDLVSLSKDGESLGTAWNGMPPGTKIGHMHLQVTDVDRSADFYKNTVGLDITHDVVPSARFLSAGGYHHHLAINNWHLAGFPGMKSDLLDSIASGQDKSEIHTDHKNCIGLSEWELVVPDTDSYEALKARLKAANALETDGHISYAVDPDGIKMAVTHS